MDRQFSPQTYLTAKALFRDLVAAAGGQTRVVGKTRACQSGLSKACSPNDPEHFPSIDQVMDLEAETGMIEISRFLADLAGYDLVPRSTAKANASPMMQIAGLSESLSAAQVAYVRAADDGTITPSERALVRGKVTDLIDRAREFDAYLATSFVKAVK
jgi:hypothetical protein